MDRLAADLCFKMNRLLLSLENCCVTGVSEMMNRTPTEERGNSTVQSATLVRGVARAPVEPTKHPQGRLWAQSRTMAPGEAGRLKSRFVEFGKPQNT